jgi:hypothetical protein
VLARQPGSHQSDNARQPAEFATRIPNGHERELYITGTVIRDRRDT